MRHIELQAEAVREYGVRYTIVLAEDDPIIVRYLAEHGLRFEDLEAAHNLHLWQDIMSDTTSDIHIDEDFGMSDEKFVSFGSFISED